ncbi:MAG: CDGSH iron-sulfur domain-containing protein [Gaiellaceae bacterium]
MSDDQKVFEFKGENADVTWDGRLCIHVGECTRAEGALFEAGRNPWCKPDESSTDLVATVVERCPTGALTVSRGAGSAAEVAAAQNTVVVSNQGPLYVRGDLEVEGAPDDAPGLEFRAALCRCGKSKNKPFCDNSHEEDAEFTDRGAVGQVGEPLEASGGKLVIKPFENGPLLLTGNVTVISGSGREAWHGSKAALCRCGASANKPFCDGTHKEIGFEAS